MQKCKVCNKLKPLNEFIYDLDLCNFCFINKRNDELWERYLNHHQLDINDQVDVLPEKRKRGRPKKTKIE
jgi:hypothetical protein